MLAKHPLRVAAFGAGWVTTARHVPTMQADSRFDVVALVDRQPGRAETEAARLGVPHALEASRVSDLAIVDEIDAVTCGTAPFGHYDVIRDALLAGKHVLTEKPFTMTVDEGAELRDLAESQGLTLAIVHNFQFAKSVQRVRRWAARGRIGQVRAIWAMQMSNPSRRLPVWFDELPLGLFYDESPHLIYLVKALAGAPLTGLSATVVPSTIGHEQTPSQITAQLRAGSVPVTLLMNFEAPVSEWQVAVIGERGMAVVDVFRDIAVFIPNDGAHHTLDVLRTSLATTLGHWQGYPRPGLGHLRKTLRYGNEEVFGRFAEAARTGTRPEGISADDALAVLRLQHWIVEEGARQSAAVAV